MADKLISSVANQSADAERSLVALKLMIAKGELNENQAKQVLEEACRLSVARKDREGLQRNLTQLKPYGINDELLALELLLLVVTSRLPDFFALLETIPSATR